MSKDSEEMRIAAKIIREEADRIPKFHEATAWLFVTVANIIDRIANLDTSAKP